MTNDIVVDIGQSSSVKVVGQIGLSLPLWQHASTGGRYHRILDAQ